MIRSYVPDSDDVKFLDLKAYTAEPLITGEVDAMTGYVTDFPYELRKAGIPYTILDPSSYGIDLYGDALYTSSQEAEQNPERVQSIRRAVLRGWRDALADPDAAIDLIQEKYDRGLAREYLEFESLMTRRVIMPELVEVGEASIERYQRIADFYSANGFAQKRVVGSDF